MNMSGSAFGNTDVYDRKLEISAAFESSSDTKIVSKLFVIYRVRFLWKSLMACIVYVQLFIMIPQEAETVALSGTGLAQWNNVGLNFLLCSRFYSLPRKI